MGEIFSVYLVRRRHINSVYKFDKVGSIAVLQVHVLVCRVIYSFRDPIDRVA